MKKTITIVIIIFLLLLAGIGYYLYINSGTQSVSKGTIFNSVKNFFPFGTPSANSPVVEEGTKNGNEQKTPETKRIDRMFQISEAPTAGFIPVDVVSTSTEIFFNKEKNATSSTSTKQTDVFVNYVERATGHLYQSKISNLEKTRLSNETKPKIYEAYLNAVGDGFITRTLFGDDIITEYRKILSGTTTPESSTIIYPYNTDIIITSGEKVFYTTKTSTGSVGYISNFENKNPTQIFSTPLRDIGASWSGGNTIEIFSKPNSKHVGVSFVVDIKKKTIKESLSGINGLNTNVSFDGKYSLYNTNIEDLSLGAKIENTNFAMYLNKKTFPEKCVWSKKDTKVVYCAVPNYLEKTGYPEKWYQGVVSFGDSFWSINVETGVENLIYQPTSDNKNSPDVINISVNNKENYLFFIDKKDLSLWGLSI